jgi:hypothetical protein
MHAVGSILAATLRWSGFPVECRIMADMSQFALLSRLEAALADSLHELAGTGPQVSGSYAGTKSGERDCAILSEVRIGERRITLAFHAQAREGGTEFWSTISVDASRPPRELTRAACVTDPSGHPATECVDAFIADTRREIGRAFAELSLSPAPPDQPAVPDIGEETLRRLWSTLYGLLETVAGKLDAIAPDLRIRHSHVHNGPFLLFTSSELAVGDRVVVLAFMVQPIAPPTGTAPGKIEVRGDIDSAEGIALREIVQEQHDVADGGGADAEIARCAGSFAAGCEQAMELICEQLGVR